MTSKHTVELEQVIKFQQKQKVLCARSTREEKELYCTLRGSYEVYHKGEKVLETIQPFTAVEKYNNL